MALIIGIALAVWSITILVLTGRDLRILFLGWRVPLTYISSLPLRGWVGVLGKARGQTLQSAFSKTPCAFWQLQIQEYRSGKNGGWRTIHKESSGSFEVDDMTGRVKIEQRNSDLVVQNEIEQSQLDSQTRTFLENLGIRTKGFLGFDKRLRVYERFIAPEQEVLVLGKIHKVDNPLTMAASSVEPAVISNLSKADMMREVFRRTFRSAIGPSLIGLVFIIFLLFFLFR